MTDPLPAAELVHGMPGRSRLKITSRRGDTGFFTAIAAGLSAYPGVSAVEVAPLTGSVLIRHLAPLDEIVATAARAGLFRMGGATEREAPLPPLEWPKVPVDPKLALVAGLAGIALWQLAKGKTLPPALTLAWYATRLAGLGGNAGSVDDAE